MRINKIKLEIIENELVKALRIMYIMDQNENNKKIYYELEEIIERYFQRNDDNSLSKLNDELYKFFFENGDVKKNINPKFKDYVYECLNRFGF